MKVATYNFLHGGSKARSTHWSALLEHADPDVVFCQEAVPHESLHGTLHWRAVPGVKWGSGVWLREGASRMRRIRSYAGWVSVVEAPDLGCVLVSVHCPAGDKGYVSSMNAILDMLKPMARRNEVIIAGDLNVATGYRDNGDVVKMSNGERALLDRMTNEFGLRSCWQAANPGVPLAQTLRWMRNPETPYHCDGIFAPPSWIDRLSGCHVITGETWTALSDHNPVVAEFTETRT